MKFLKMNGCGNEFAIFDVRGSGAPLRLDEVQIRALAGPASAAACDQLIAMEMPVDAKAPVDAKTDVFMRIWNADGSEVSACGNATRCVGWRLMEESGQSEIRIGTGAGVLVARRAPMRDGQAQICIDMGPPKLDWEDIPLSERMDTRGIDIKVGPIDAPVLSLPGAVNMGNPHAVFFVENLAEIDVATLGEMLEHHPLFPQAANIGFAQVIAKDEIRLRVWERGAGLTRACGTGACAALIACHRRQLCDRKASLILDGGTLHIEWREDDDHVLMTGPIELEFEGDIKI